MFEFKFFVMNVFDLFGKNACSLGGGDSLKWSWAEYYASRKKLEAEGKTIFVLYCHSGGSSGFLQKQLTPKFPQYNFVNMAGGIGAYVKEN